MRKQAELINVCRAFLAPHTIVNIDKLHKGLSNENYLIQTQSHTYVLKYYKTRWPQQGLQAQDRLSKQRVCPAPVWLNEPDMQAAFEYIEGHTATLLMPSNLVRKLAKMHSFDVDAPHMNISHELSDYKSHSAFKHYEQHLKKALATVACMPVNLGFCHNDLVKENIIVNSQDVYFIDFEYAKKNDVYFDLAALTVSFDLGRNEQISLLEAYKEHSCFKTKFYLSVDKLNCFKCFYLLLCICWYEQRAINNRSIVLRAQLDELVLLL